MPRLWPFISLLSFWLLDPLLGVGAVPTNRTIDDSLGDSVTGTKPVYRPPIAGGVWADQTCPAGKCAIRPSTQSAFKGTWTAATYLPSLGSISIELNFKGTAIYVYFILANNVAPGVTTRTACNFILDGSHAASFSHTPSSSTQFEYNALVFSTDNLQNSAHKLTIETSDVDHDIFVNFDYAIYTSEDTVIDTTPSLLGSTSTTSSLSTTSTAGSSTKTFNPLNSSSTSSGFTSTTPTNMPSDGNNNGGGSSPSTNNSHVSNDNSSGSKTNSAAIAGGAVGGVVVLAAAIFGLLFCLRRRKRFDLTNDSPSNDNTTALVNPFNDSVPSISGQHRNMPSSNLPMDQGFSPAVTYNDLGQSSKILTGERNTSSTMLSNSDSPSDGGVEEVYTRPPPTPPVLRKPPFPTMDDTLVPLMEGDDGKLLEQTRNLPSQDQEIWRMRDQMQVLSEQIQLLRSQRGSERAQRFSAEPPPSYMSPFPDRDSYYRQ